MSENDAKTEGTSPKSWIALYPWWYRDERERLARRAPEFVVSDRALAAGRLEIAGEIRIDLGASVHLFYVLLVYHAETPFRFPSVFPLRELPHGDDWIASDLLRVEGIQWMNAGWRRHQMANGSLCLIETDRHLEAELMSGVAVLERARGVFRAIALGNPHPYPDTLQAELQEHYDGLPADILLGGVFFDEEVRGGGTFFAIPTLDDRGASPNHVVQADPARTLYVGLHLTAHQTEGGAVETDWRTERSQAIRAAFPFLANENLGFEAQVIRPGGLFATFGISGPWFDLKSEPEPVRTVKELEAMLLNWTDVADPLSILVKYSKDTGSGRAVFLGLRYPAREGGLDWLFLFAASPEVVDREVERDEGPGLLRDILRGGRVTALRRHILVQKHLEVRNGDIAGRLTDRRVLLLGAGAIGGDIADVLGKAGVGQLIIVDPDRMGPGNSIRHVAGIAATGLRKPDALRQVISQHNPFVLVEAVAYSATDPLEHIDELLKTADLAVSTIADENTEYVINEAAVRLGKTVIYGRALRAGSACRVFRVRPGRDACKACLGAYSAEARQRSGERAMLSEEAASPIGVDDWTNVPEIQGEIVGHECGNPILAGSAVDLRFAADHTARAVLDELEGTGAAGVDGWNSLIWTREPLPEPVHSDLRRPYGTLRQRIPPHPNCPICARPRIRSIILAASADRELRRLAEAKPDRETGGALIGFETTGSRVVVMQVTDAGPKATETPGRFLYDPDHINALLRDAWERLRDRGAYVGEWHTHLEPKPRPSARDSASLSAIAEEAKYLTDEPVMLIAGVDPGTRHVVEIHASSWPVHRAMNELMVSVVIDDAIAAALPLRDS